MALGTLLGVGAARGDRAPAVGQPPKALDEQLLDSLGPDALDKINRPPVPPGQKPGGDEPGKPDAVLEKQLQRELGAAATSGNDDDPLLLLARRMREIEARIAQADCGPDTQQVQKQVLADLDALIRQARCSGGACPSSGQAKPGGTQPRDGGKPSGQKPGGGKPNGGGAGKPASGGSQAKQPGPKRPDMVQMRVLLKELWGELPARQREQMLQLPVDEFLPEYEGMIEDYFERLLEE